MIPEYYSRDIATRCGRLIEDLMPYVEAREYSEFGGALTCTFLLSLATPMIVFPFERLHKVMRAGDDKEIDPSLTDELKEVFNEPFEKSPFCGDGDWSFVENYCPFNIADIWPQDVIEKLKSSEAKDQARNSTTKKILEVLRNALAHGGVNYLNEDGHQTDRIASMFAFVSTIKEKSGENRGQIIGLDILRIRQDDLREFLKKWAAWLGERSDEDKKVLLNE